MKNTHTAEGALFTTDILRRGKESQLSTPTSHVQSHHEIQVEVEANPNPGMAQLIIFA